MQVYFDVTCGLYFGLFGCFSFFSPNMNREEGILNYKRLIHRERY